MVCQGVYVGRGVGPIYYKKVVQRLLEFLNSSSDSQNKNLLKKSDELESDSEEESDDQCPDIFWDLQRDVSKFFKDKYNLDIDLLKWPHDTDPGMSGETGGASGETSGEKYWAIGYFRYLGENNDSKDIEDTLKRVLEADMSLLSQIFEMKTEYITIKDDCRCCT